MIKEALDYIFNTLAHPLVAVTEVDGLKYKQTANNIELLSPPLTQHVNLTTLSGIIDLLELGIEGKTEEELKTTHFLKVVNEKKIELLQRSADKYGRRDWLLVSEAMVSQPFQFGTYLAPENFIIGLSSGFVPSDELDRLISLASNLTSESSAEAVDNGITQSVVVRNGAALKKAVETKPRVTLAPYRTFSEARQPESDFIFRVKKIADGQPPNCALFEADGGAWKAQAMQNIKSYLELKTKVTVIA